MLQHDFRLSVQANILPALFFSSVVIDDRGQTRNECFTGHFDFLVHDVNSSVELAKRAHYILLNVYADDYIRERMEKDRVELVFDCHVENVDFDI